MTQKKIAFDPIVPFKNHCCSENSKASLPETGKKGSLDTVAQRLKHTETPRTHLTAFFPKVLTI